jgi:hypothetical protein
MSEADGSIPTTVTRKRRRGSGFRYSSRKVLQRSRVRREAAKGTVLELGSVRKALSYPVDPLSEIGVVDLGDCSNGPASLYLVDENEVERTEESIEIGDTIAGCLKKVSIILFRISQYLIIIDSTMIFKA